jgi:hypothetical protein
VDQSAHDMPGQCSWRAGSRYAMRTAKHQD